MTSRIRGGAGGFGEERQDNADTNLNWRRGLPVRPRERVVREAPQREEAPPQAPPPAPLYSAPPAPWATARPPPVRQVDESAFPTLGATPLPAEEAALPHRRETTESTHRRDDDGKPPARNPWVVAEEALAKKNYEVTWAKRKTHASPSKQNPWSSGPQGGDSKKETSPRPSESRLWPSLGSTTVTPPKVKKPAEIPKKAAEVVKSSKPKPQKSYSIMDALKTRVDVKKKVPPPAAEVTTKKKTNVELEDQKPKRRRLSSLKKRVLLERLEKYKSYKAQEKEKHKTRDDDKEEVVRVRLLNGARLEEVEEEEERLEILGDVAEMCSALGAAPMDTKILGAASENEFAVIEVSFENAEAALMVARGLKGRVLGGEKLGLEIVRNEVAVSLDEYEKNFDDDAKVTDMLVRAQDIRLVGIVSEEERKRIENDDDELDEIVEDLRELVENKCGEFLKVVAVDVVVSTGDAVISFESSEDKAALRAIDLLNEVSLGGEQVEARLNERARLLLKDVCSDEALDDDDEVAETASDLANICRRKLAAFNDGRGDFLSSVDVIGKKSMDGAGDAILETKLDAHLALKALEGLVLGGLLVEVAILTTGDMSSSLLPQTSQKDASQRRLLTSKRTGRVIEMPLKYAEAFLTPRVKEDDGYYPRPYAASKQPLDGELDDHVSTFLGKLFEFQERVRLNDPLKARRLRRLVFGLREVKRGLKAKNVKLLVIAPNIENSRDLDDNVKDIMREADDAEVPTVFALTKKRLGAALRKFHVGVSAVGVYSDDGANEDFRKIIGRRKAILADPTIAVHPRDYYRAQKKQQQQQQQQNDAKVTPPVAQPPAKENKKEEEASSSSSTKKKTTLLKKKKESLVSSSQKTPAPSYSSAVTGAAPQQKNNKKSSSPRSSSMLTATAPAFPCPGNTSPLSSLSAATPVFFFPAAQLLQDNTAAQPPFISSSDDQQHLVEEYYSPTSSSYFPADGHWPAATMTQAPL